MEKAIYGRTLKNVISIKNIYSVHYFEFKSSFEFEGEKHNFWELVYIDKGNAVAVSDKQNLFLSQGELIFHKPNEFHAIKADKDNPPNVFVITFDSDSKQINYFEKKRMSIPDNCKKYISEIISNSREAYCLSEDTPYSEGLIVREDAPFGSEQLIKLNLEMLLIKLIRYSDFLMKDLNENQNKLIKDIISILKTNIYGKITVENICRELGFSRAYISSQFKKSCGQTITEYLSELKINEAKYLIRKNVYTVTEIAELLCFENPQYFCRVFKKTAKMTPSEYKASVDYSK